MYTEPQYNRVTNVVRLAGDGGLDANDIWRELRVRPNTRDDLDNILKDLTERGILFLNRGVYRYVDEAYRQAPRKTAAQQRLSSPNYGIKPTSTPKPATVTEAPVKTGRSSAKPISDWRSLKRAMEERAIEQRSGESSEPAPPEPAPPEPAPPEPAPPESRELSVGSSEPVLTPATPTAISVTTNNEGTHNHLVRRESSESSNEELSPSNGRGRMGSIRRTAPKGSIALFLYNARNEPQGVSIQHLLALTGGKFSYPSLYSVIQSLVKGGYLSAETRHRDNRYRWSGKYGYPFNYWESEDARLLDVFTVKVTSEFVRETTPASTPGYQTTQPSPPTVVDPLRLIKTAQLSLLESQIESLQNQASRIREELALTSA